MLVFCLDDAFFTANKCTGYEIDGSVYVHLYSIYRCQMPANVNVDMIIISNTFTCAEIKLEQIIELRLIEYLKFILFSYWDFLLQFAVWKF